MRRLLALLATVLSALPALAEVPALHNVSGVAANDVLNIRAEPTAQSALLGALAPDAKGIEVVRIDPESGWGLVRAGEGSGWVSMNFMTEQGETGSHRMACFGTEPFWNLDLDGKRAAISEMGGLETPLLINEDSSAGRGSLLRMGDGEMSATMMIETAICSDGMSDREYGFAARLFVTTPQSRFLSGCCTLQVMP